MTAIDYVRQMRWRLIFIATVSLATITAGAYVFIALCHTRPQTSQVADSEPIPQASNSGEHSTGKVHFDILAQLLANDRRSQSAEEWLGALAASSSTARVASQQHPLLDQSAPAFTLFDSAGASFDLASQCERGPVIVVFYLGYFCNACVHDLFELNADLDRFRMLGAEVVAISGDTPESTRLQFERYGPFSYRVLSDPEHTTARSFGVFAPASESAPEKLLHGTFLVARDGHIRWACTGDTPFRDNKALLYEVARLENKLLQADATAVIVPAETELP